MIYNLNERIKPVYKGDVVKEAGVFIPRDELDTMYDKLIKESRKLIEETPAKKSKTNDFINSARERIAVSEFILNLMKRFEGIL